MGITRTGTIAGPMAGPMAGSITWSMAGSMAGLEAGAWTRTHSRLARAAVADPFLHRLSLLWSHAARVGTPVRIDLATHPRRTGGARLEVRSTSVRSGRGSCKTTARPRGSHRGTIPRRSARASTAHRRTTPRWAARSHASRRGTCRVRSTLHRATRGCTTWGCTTWSWSTHLRTSSTTWTTPATTTSATTTPATTTTLGQDVTRRHHAYSGYDQK